MNPGVRFPENPGVFPEKGTNAEKTQFMTAECHEQAIAFRLLSREDTHDLKPARQTATPLPCALPPAAARRRNNQRRQKPFRPLYFPDHVAGFSRRSACVDNQCHGHLRTRPARQPFALGTGNLQDGRTERIAESCCVQQRYSRPVPLRQQHNSLAATCAQLRERCALRAGR